MEVRARFAMTIARPALVLLPLHVILVTQGITFRMGQLHALFFALLANIIDLEFKYKSVIFVMQDAINALIHQQPVLLVCLFQPIIISTITPA